jgi:signal transduction histidine kinase
MFISARRRLTAWYLLILMSVSISFSVVIYKGMMMELDRFSHLQQLRFEQRFAEAGIPRPPITIDSEVVNEVKKRIIISLLSINGIIFVAMGGLSYFLAGRTLEPIQEMMEEQNRFISDASHELKTPLTAMKSALEVYVRDPKMTLSEAKTVLLDNIEEVNRLQKLSESLLTLSEIQGGNSGQFFIRLDLKTTLDKVFNQVKHGAKNKKIELRFSPIPQRKIEGNEEKLIELFTILLDNAVKYSSEGSPLLVSGALVRKGIEISVNDKGIGIDEKDIPHIFDRFYRSDSARSKIGTGGYGLGLSIAKKIVELHNGTIHIESTAGFGTTVLVWLPFHSAYFQN